MKFEKLIQSILKENITYPTRNLPDIRIINEKKIIPTIEADIENAWLIWKKKYKDTNAPQYEKRVLSLYREFIDPFKANIRVNLSSSILGDHFYKGKLVDAKIKIIETRINAVDNDVSRVVIRYSVLAVYDFPSDSLPNLKLKVKLSNKPTQESESNLFLFPITQEWSSENEMISYMNPKSQEFDPDNISIFSVYSFLNKTFRNLDEYNPIEIQRKRFNLDDIPDKAFDLMYKAYSDAQYSEFMEIMKDATEQKFEDTIKSQRVGRVTSKL